MRKLLFIFTLAILAGAVFPPLLLQAAAPTLKGAPSVLEDIGKKAYGDVAGSPEALPALVGRIISIFLDVVGLLFFVLMVYGGYLWMNARGDQEKVNKAKDLITDSIIGLIIVLAAYIISHFVVEMLVGATLTP